MRRGVLLLAHGSPESLADLPAYLARVRGGRPPTPELLAEMRIHYEAIGGRSPLLERTRAQAEALERELADGTSVQIGMRYSDPFIAEAVSQAQAEGVDSLVVLPLAPQYSRFTIERYREAVEAEGIRVRFVGSWHVHPGLLDAFAEKLRAAPGESVVFTAHSLPRRIIDEGDPYAHQVEQTAAGVAQRAGIETYAVAYQSAGRTPEPWLGPTLADHITECARAGVRRLVVCPIGFVSDHAEILYDIDIEARAHADHVGVTLARTESLNDSATFIRALADIVRAHRG